MVSRKVVLSAFHCVNDASVSVKQLCDLSDGKRKAILGQHNFYLSLLHTYISIPIVDAKAPSHVGLLPNDNLSHDFVLLILAKDAIFSTKVSPICLPRPDQDITGKWATAVGWGRYDHASRESSTFLRKVELKVDSKIYQHKFMFGTKIGWTETGIAKDPCEGDSGQH